MFEVINLYIKFKIFVIKSQNKITVFQVNFFLNSFINRYFYLSLHGTNQIKP